MKVTSCMQFARFDRELRMNQVNEYLYKLIFNKYRHCRRPIYEGERQTPQRYSQL